MLRLTETLTFERREGIDICSGKDTQINMSNLHNIIFDFGNVLFHLDLDATERVLRQRLNSHFDTMHEKLLAADVFRQYETGALTTDAFIGAIRSASDYLLSEKEILEAWNAIFISMPTIYFDLLERLREHYRLYLLSNINDLHARWIDDYMRNIHQQGNFRQRYFDKVYYSYEVGMRKPEKSIYTYVLQDAGIRPEETVFIDDLEINVRAAESVGIRGIVKTPELDTAQLMYSFLP